MKRSAGRSAKRRPSKPRVAARRSAEALDQTPSPPLEPAQPSAPETEPRNVEPAEDARITPEIASAAPQGDQAVVATVPATTGSADAPPPTSSSRIEEFLGFRLDEEEYCVWIRSIKEIIRPPEITPIPRSPADIRGLISLRGTIVPVFDIRRRLGLPARDIGPKSRIVVVVLDVGPVGMVVDHVTEVISVNADALEPPPPTMGERETSMVTATVRLRDRIVGVLHLDRLVAIDTEAPLRAVA